VAFPIPTNEQGRLSALRELAIIDTSPEQTYDDVAQLAAAICRAPVAMINFVDADRQWGKALVGIDRARATREHSFCARTIVAEDGLLEVPDTRADPNWASNPLVVSGPRFGFYAGAAVVTEDGYALGTVCVAGPGPQQLDDQQRAALRILARQVAAYLDLRRQSKSLIDVNAELRKLAVEDRLTGLANRTLLLDRLGLALRHRRRTKKPLGLLFCDLNDFKGINDRLGHDAGDELLRAIAARLFDASRASDTVARFGGDEFVIVCPELSDPSDLDIVVRRLAGAMVEAVLLRGELVTPSISIGAALALDTDHDDGSDLLRRADEAMYEAKRASKAAAFTHGLV
jgi:diguanylate cyclase (GGDEF)-like protein